MGCKDMTTHTTVTGPTRVGPVTVLPGASNVSNNFSRLSFQWHSHNTIQYNLWHRWSGHIRTPLRDQFCSVILSCLHQNFEDSEDLVQ